MESATVAAKSLVPIDLSEHALDGMANLLCTVASLSGAAEDREQIAAFRALARRISTEDSEREFEGALRRLMAQAPKLEPSKESGNTHSDTRAGTSHTIIRSIADDITQYAGCCGPISCPMLESNYFENERDAFVKFESIAWPQGLICAHCGHRGRAYHLSKTRIGLKKCRRCGRQFTVRIGTAVEASHLPLHKWLQAIYLLRAGAKPITAQQLQRTLEITYKSACLTARRVRKAETTDRR